MGARTVMTLDEVAVGGSAVVDEVGGSRAFRRRLMELGVIPGTSVQVLRVAPFGDPLELCARGCNLSIRSSEARQVRVLATPDEGGSSGERAACSRPRP